jgi:hypothetical protein
MKALFKSTGTGWGSFFYLVLLMPIASFATESWRPAHYGLMAMLALFYVWRFLIQPFRAGLRDEVNRA